MPSAWIVTIGEPPFSDLGSRLWRSGAIARDLSLAGWDVTYWCSSYDHFRKQQAYSQPGPSPSPQPFRLMVLSGRLYKKNVSVMRLVNHRQVARSFRRQAAELSAPDLMVVSFPPIGLAATAMSFARRRGVAAVLDIRDPWPDVFETAVPSRLRFTARALLGPARSSARRVISQTRHAMAVSDAYLAWATDMGLPSSARTGVFPLSYAPAEVGPDAQLRAHEIVANLRCDRLVVFVGTFGVSYDLRTVIESAREFDLRSEGPRVGFILCGDGDQSARVRAASTGLSNVYLTGWLGAEDVSAILRLSDIGLMSYAKSAHQSIPNKFFEYLAHGAAVVSSLSDPMVTAIREGAVGESYAPESVESLTRTIAKLVNRLATLDQMKAQAALTFSRLAGTNQARTLDFLKATLEANGQ